MDGGGETTQESGTVPDKSQQGMSILTVGMILRGDPLLPPAGSMRHLSVEME